jgi:hypothetical protein
MDRWEPIGPSHKGILPWEEAREPASIDEPTFLNICPRNVHLSVERLAATGREVLADSPVGVFTTSSSLGMNKEWRHSRRWSRGGKRAALPKMGSLSRILVKRQFTERFAPRIVRP